MDACIFGALRIVAIVATVDDDARIGHIAFETAEPQDRRVQAKLQNVKNNENLSGDFYLRQRHTPQRPLPYLMSFRTFQIPVVEKALI